MRAQAYCNLGRWIADCPRDDCNNAVAVAFGETQFYCVGGCLLLGDLEWPPDLADLVAALDQRPVLGTRNWAPAGHRQAVTCGFPEGQAPADLVAETHEYLHFAADQGGQ